MIRVNYREMEWEKGLTVEKLLQKLKEDSSLKYFMSSKATVVINSEVVPPTEYSSRLIQDGDDIRIYPFVAGG